jgi:hypothetical protein
MPRRPKPEHVHIPREARKAFGGQRDGARQRGEQAPQDSQLLPDVPDVRQFPLRLRNDLHTAVEALVATTRSVPLNTALTDLVAIGVAWCLPHLRAELEKAEAELRTLQEDAAQIRASGRTEGGLLEISGVIEAKAQAEVDRFATAIAACQRIAESMPAGLAPAFLIGRGDGDDDDNAQESPAARR